MKKTRLTHTHQPAEQSETSGVIRSKGRIIEVWYALDVKLSRDYQSVGIQYGAKASVRKEDSVDRVFRNITGVVQEKARVRMPEVIKLLEQMKK